MQVLYSGKSSFDPARQSVRFEALVDGKAMEFEIGACSLRKLCDDAGDPLAAFEAARQVILHCIVDKLGGSQEGPSDWLIIREVAPQPSLRTPHVDLVLFPQAVSRPEVQTENNLPFRPRREEGDPGQREIG